MLSLMVATGISTVIYSNYRGVAKLILCIIAAYLFTCNIMITIKNVSILCTIADVVECC